VTEGGLSSDALQLDDVNRISSYMAKKLDLAGAVTSVVKFPRGVSRETWFVTFEAESPERAGPIVLTIRRDLEGGSVCPAPLRREYDIYRCLGKTDVPAAEALWYEDHPEHLLGGREFYVRLHVEGDWEVPGLMDLDPRFDALREATSREHLRNMALVHLVDWNAAGFGEVLEVPDSPAAAARAAIDRIVAQLREIQFEPLPVVEEAIGWLRRNAPTDAPAVCLIKGTNGLGEEVFRNGKIVAMSDWELSSLGDPAYDFAQMQAFLPQDGRPLGAWSMDDALAYYASLTGFEISKPRIAFYRLICALERVMYLHHSARAVARREDLLVRLCWTSTEVIWGAQRELLNAVMAAQDSSKVRQ